MAANFADIIAERLQPMLIDTVFNKQKEVLTGIFGVKKDVRSGSKITESMRTDWTSNGAAYDKNSVDVAGSTQTIVNPYWTKVQYNFAAEVYNIDEYNNINGDVAIDAAADAIAQELKALAAEEFDATFTRFLADVDSSATDYSDAALSRSTYATLASYEETTNATVTLNYVRGMINETVKTKNVQRSDYVILMEEVVYNTFTKLAAAEHTWNQNGDVSLAGRSYGYAPTGSFEGIPVYSVPGMLTGSVYMLRVQDVKLVETMPLRMELKNSARDTKLVQIYHGWTPYIVNPGFQGKMLDKD